MLDNDFYPSTTVAAIFVGIKSVTIAAASTIVAVATIIADAECCLLYLH